MRARLALIAGCFLWLSYESHFSPTFFVATVETSLAQILGGIDDAIAAESAAVATKSEWITVESPVDEPAVVESPAYVRTAAK